MMRTVVLSKLLLPKSQIQTIHAKIIFLNLSLRLQLIEQCHANNTKHLKTPNLSSLFYLLTLLLSWQPRFQNVHLFSILKPWTALTIG